MCRVIKMIRIMTPRSTIPVKHKSGAYADDVHTICKADQGSVQGIFTQYERLTKRSGLELNAEKTEILLMHTDQSREYTVQYCGTEVKLATLKEVKICGIWYCRDQERSYKLNVIDKIVKLESNLRMWKNRFLTFEGKSLITKAFGLSQLVYSLQVLEVRKRCIIRIERSSFGFLWIGCRSEKEKGIDRIKRSVLKNGYECGGLNITDVC